MKQKNGSVYLSSNNKQIKGHIDNLAAKHRSDIANGFKPDFTLITTFDASFSSKTLKYASEAKVYFQHRKAQYKIVNGNYKFRFVNAGNPKYWKIL